MVLAVCLGECVVRREIGIKLLKVHDIRHFCLSFVCIIGGGDASREMSKKISNCIRNNVL